VPPARSVRLVAVVPLAVAAAGGVVSPADGPGVVAAVGECASAAPAALACCSRRLQM
jgi:hypothetical protein